MSGMQFRKYSFEELKQQSMSLSQLKESPRLPLYVIVENVRSLYNVGSIFRTADGLRFSQIILTGYTGRPPREEIDKAALGAVETVPWMEYDTSAEGIKILKKNKIPVIGLEQTEKSIDFQEFDYSFPSAIILGNEFNGIDQATLDMCDACVSLPMLGIKHSLNVGTAFGVIAYEMFKQLKISVGNGRNKNKYQF